MVPETLEVDDIVTEHKGKWGGGENAEAHLHEGAGKEASRQGDRSGQRGRRKTKRDLASSKSEKRDLRSEWLGLPWWSSG